MTGSSIRVGTPPRRIRLVRLIDISATVRDGSPTSTIRTDRISLISSGRVHGRQAKPSAAMTICGRPPQ